MVSDDHIGLINIVPYYNVREGNTVALSITNNDFTNGKVVKVRFRGAEWSDDVLDFQVFLSPFDVWTASITRGVDPDTGKAVAKLNKSEDNTCTRPQLGANGALFKDDLNRVAVGTEGGTLEGYVEIITLADIPQLLNGAVGSATATAGEFDAPAADGGSTAVHANPLYDVIKHANTGAAPLCRTDDNVYRATIGSLIEDSYWSYPAVGASIGANGVHLYAENGTNNDDGWDTFLQPVATKTYNGKGQFGAAPLKASDDWLQFPTPGISSYVSIINVQSKKAYTLQATALKNAPVVDDISATTGVVTNTVAVVNASSRADVQWANVAVGSIKAYFKQRYDPVAFPAADLPVPWNGKGDLITADKLFGDTAGLAPTKYPASAFAGLALLELDLPDLSTPTTAAVAGIGFAADTVTTSNLVGASSVYPGGPAAAQRDLVAAALQAPAFAFEYVTGGSIQGSTDIVINQPLRRYYYWYTPAPTGEVHREFTLPAGKFRIFGEINTPYSALRGLTNTVPVGAAWFSGREEEVSVGGADTWSPAPPAGVAGLIGEVAVVEVNGNVATDSEALGAKLTKNVLKTTYSNGWGQISTTKAGGDPAGVFVVGTAGTLDFALGAATGHSLLRKRTATTFDTFSLPFIAYSAINVVDTRSGVVYGTTLPVRKID
ncbi:hypothetical protein AGMMS50243_21130 [Betaproteobacteria bacterium]|nr:hypothetical protein AGMMS50243_21130 [Betaproteobacteria bacterium]